MVTNIESPSERTDSVSAAGVRRYFGALSAFRLMVLTPLSDFCLSQCFPGRVTFCFWDSCRRAEQALCVQRKAGLAVWGEPVSSQIAG